MKVIMEFEEVLGVMLLVALFLALIGVGVYMYIFDRRRLETEEVKSDDELDIPTEANTRTEKRRLNVMQRMKQRRDARDARAQEQQVQSQQALNEEGESSMPSKMGKKKLAKLERKRENAERNEQMRQERLEKDKRDRERRKEEAQFKEQQALEKARLEEIETKKRTEREAVEKEEYMKWKDLISVEAGGSKQEEDEENSEGLLERFVAHFKTHKIVVLDDAAAHFHMKTQDVVMRLKDLEEMGYITGVIDDRGKFIYVSKEEMDNVARFIEKKGRISISELASECSRLISLESTQESVPPPTQKDGHDITPANAEPKLNPEL